MATEETGAGPAEATIAEGVAYRGLTGALWTVDEHGRIVELRSPGRIRSAGQVGAVVVGDEEQVALAGTDAPLDSVMARIAKEEKAMAELAARINSR